MSPDETTAPTPKRRRLERVAAACDFCKKRKVKCDGEQPCAYCTRKNCAEACTFSAPSRTRVQGHSVGNTPRDSTGNLNGGVTPLTSRDRAFSESVPRRARTPENTTAPGNSISPALSKDGHQEDTVVPLEGRILRDAQGQVIFIGDCAPLSFLQTVRHLIASEVVAEEFPVSRDPIIEVTGPGSIDRQQQQPLFVAPHEVQSLFEEYAVATRGLVDLFSYDKLLEMMKVWSRDHTPHSEDSLLFFLVLAIGAQEHHESKAEAWFRHAQDNLVKRMCNNMNVRTVQGFTLVAIFMLRAFQPNGAYLYFCKPFL